MIDCLGSTIIQKPGQIISFVDNVLENYGQKGFSNSAQSRDSSSRNPIIVVEEDSDEDEEPVKDQQEEDETLALALTLLTSLLAGSTLRAVLLTFLNLLFFTFLTFCGFPNSNTIARKLPPHKAGESHSRSSFRPSCQVFQPLVI